MEVTIKGQTVAVQLPRMDQMKTLQITIQVQIMEPLSARTLEDSIARDVLEWIHSDDSGIAGDPEASVKAEVLDGPVSNYGFFRKSSRQQYETSGEKYILA